MLPEPLIGTDVSKNKYSECARACRLAIIKHFADLENDVVLNKKIGCFYNIIMQIKNWPANLVLVAWLKIQMVTLFLIQLIVLTVSMISFVQCLPLIIIYYHILILVSLSMFHSTTYITFTRTDVFKILKRLNAKSAGGPHHIPPILLKNIAPSIAAPLASMFELFIHHSFLSKIWRESIVKPIFKNKDSSSVINYRPISLVFNMYVL